MNKPLLILIAILLNIIILILRYNSHRTETKIEYLERMRIEKLLKEVNNDVNIKYGDPCPIFSLNDLKWNYYSLLSIRNHVIWLLFFDIDQIKSANLLLNYLNHLY